jgi:hypothetical protein
LMESAPYSAMFLGWSAMRGEPLSLSAIHSGLTQDCHP